MTDKELKKFTTWVFRVRYILRWAREAQLYRKFLEECVEDLVPALEIWWREGAHPARAAQYAIECAKILTEEYADNVPGAPGL